MKTAVVLALVCVASASAKPLFADMDYHRYLEDKDKVKEAVRAYFESEAGLYAVRENIFTRDKESRDGEPTDEEMQRFFKAQQLCEELAKAHPEANFTTDSPFTMLTEDEFAKYVGLSSQGEDALSILGRHAADEDESKDESTDHSDDNEESRRLRQLSTWGGDNGPRQWSSTNTNTYSSNGRVHPSNVNQDPRQWFNSWWNSWSFPNGGGNNGNNPRQNDVTRAPCPTSATPMPVAPDADSGRTVAPQPSRNPYPWSRQPQPRPQPWSRPSVRPQPWSRPSVRPQPGPAPQPRPNPQPAPRPQPGPAPQPTYNPVGPVAPSEAPGPAPNTPSYPTDSTLVDWNQKGCMTPVRNQGQCGSCWAFAAVAAIESALCIKSGSGRCTSLSDQQLTSCDQRNMGCNGGVPSWAIDWVKNNGGLCTLESYPYRGQDRGYCNSQCQKVSFTINRAVQVRGTEDNLAEAIRRQPVVVAVAAGNRAWKQYRGGVLNSCDTQRIDHAVLAFGYTQDAWLIKNSWGTSWGEQGVIRLRRAGGQGICGIMQQAVYPEVA